MSDVASRAQVLGLTAQIVSAHVSHNAIPSDALSGLIQSVFRTLSTVGVDAPVPDKPQPAVPVKKSVFPDHIVCLEDGKKLKMLKRHLQTSYQMTPEQYRERWGLPADYPMVAPNYAERRFEPGQEDRPGPQARGGGTGPRTRAGAPAAGGQTLRPRPSRED